MRAVLPLLLLTGCMGAWNEVVVSEPILQDTLWTADTTWILDGVIYVEQGIQLTIEPGTTILGNNGSALVVTRDAAILARGAADRPIVFTSSQEPGTRAPGDWGGVALLGTAPVNQDDARIEGVPPDDTRGNYGGDQPFSSCGTLEWVRIEYAGFEAFQNNELNGLTLGGCGGGTILRNIQVHEALDDGVEFFGGAADAKNLVITGARDDSLDWDQGWQGRIQFLIVQQNPAGADNGIEADNDGDEPDLEPRSAPRIWNATFIGVGEGGEGQRGAVLRRGTAGIIANSVFAGFPQTSIDIRSEASVARVELGELDVRHTVVADIGPDGRTFFEPETNTDDEADDFDDDAGFDEEAFFEDPDRSNRAITGDLFSAAYDLSEPDFTPRANAPEDLEGGPVPGGEFWDPSGTWVGAVAPAEEADSGWWRGWTTFVRN